MIIIEQVKNMERTEIIEKLTAAGLHNYGVYREPLVAGWMEAAAIGHEEQVSMKIIAGLNNSDTEGVLLAVLRNDADRVFNGMQIAAYAMEAEEMILYLPEYAEGMEAVIEKAESFGIKVETGVINRRSYQGCVLNHIVAMAGIADCIEGTYEPGVYVSVNGAPLIKADENMTVSELLSTEAVKGLELGYRITGPEAAELTLKEADIANGVIRTYSDKDCIIQAAEKNLLTYRKQSCGRCVFCREGLLQLHSIVKEAAEGKGRQEQLDIMMEIGTAMTFSTPCSLGQKSAEAALGSLEHFRPEYDAHIKKKQCPAGVCFSSITFYINPKTCEGCGDCIDVCPADCIEGKPGYIHMIDRIDCTACGKCLAACENDAVEKTEGKLPKLPNRLTKCGKFKKH